jgi:hypothetical protein
VRAAGLMRIIFAAYLTLIVCGLAFYLVVALLDL